MSFHYFDLDVLLEADDKEKINASPKADDNETNYDIEDTEQEQEEDPKVKNADAEDTDYDIEDTDDTDNNPDDNEEPTEDDTDTEDTNYDIEDNEGSDDDTGDDGEGEDATSGEEDENSQENSSEKTLKPENLFRNYELLYKGISNLATLVNSISVRSDSEVDIVDRVLNSLRNLETLVFDYMTKVYDSKSYGENLTNLREFQAVLDINVRLIQKISQNRESEDKTSN